jgi:hypothetical protein
MTINEDLMPYPQKAIEVQQFWKQLQDESGSDDWKGKKLSLDYIFKKYKDSVIKNFSADYKWLNIHLLYRACNQINEACNKIWGTAELYYHLKDCDSKLCDDFSSGFIPSSTIPVLYYSAISSMIGILSIYGVCSYVDKVDDFSKVHFYNIVRTKQGFVTKHRVEYLDLVFGTHRKGWHDQIIQMYRDFSKFGLELPVIDLEALHSLKTDRSYYDYDILSQTTMSGTYGERKYFEHVPSVLKIIETGINSLKMNFGIIPNKCDERFNSLTNRLPILFEKYGEKL